ncbi:hypothetical protein [Streptomyces sp. NPDC002346]
MRTRTVSGARPERVEERLWMPRAPGRQLGVIRADFALPDRHGASCGAATP